MAGKLELAWAAGLFEGEGWITHGWNRNKNRGKNVFPRPQVGLAMMAPDRAVVDHFAAIMGFGHVYGPYANGHRGVVKWMANSFEHCQAAVATLWPWLSRRRRDQAVAMFKFLKEARLGR